jgi:hypothetical protein
MILASIASPDRRSPRRSSVAYFRQYAPSSLLALDAQFVALQVRSHLPAATKHLAELGTAAAAARDELVGVVAQLRASWATLTVAARRDILRAHVPGGFRLMPGRRLRAEVCGVTLEAAIPENAPTRPGVKYGGRKRGATN